MAPSAEQLRRRMGPFMWQRCGVSTLLEGKSNGERRRKDRANSDPGANPTSAQKAPATSCFEQGKGPRCGQQACHPRVGAPKEGSQPDQSNTHQAASYSPRTLQVWSEKLAHHKTSPTRGIKTSANVLAVTPRRAVRPERSRGRCLRRQPPSSRVAQSTGATYPAQRSAIDEFARG